MRTGRWRAAARDVSLRTWVMAAAALLVTLTSLVTAVLGTTLLRSYLLSRSDAQLRDFATVVSRITARQQLQPSGSSRPQTLPTQFLVEVIGAGGQVSMAGGPLGTVNGPRLSTVQLTDTGTPFTAPAAGTSGGSWRVLVQRLAGGGDLSRRIAALSVYPGGVVDRVVSIGNGDYEVHNIGVNWPHHVFENSDFQVIGADD
jgi:hypothetical protein